MPFCKTATLSGSAAGLLTALRRRERALGFAYGLSLLLLFGLASGLSLDATSDPRDRDGFTLSYQPRPSWQRALLLLGATGLVLLSVRGASGPSGDFTPLSQLEGDARQLSDRLDAGALGSMIEELAEGLGGLEVSEVLIDDSPSPNAMTYSKLGSGNVVIIHSNLVTLLSPDQLRAILAHELAHAGELHSLLSQLRAAPKLLASIFLLLFLAQAVGGLLDPPSLAVFLSRALFVAELLVVTALVLGWLQTLGAAHSRAQERVADLLAAGHCGWLELINALLRLGERTESLEVVSAAFFAMSLREFDALDPPGDHDALQRVLRHFPPGAVDDATARALVPRIFIYDRLEQLRRYYGLKTTELQSEALACEAAARLEPLSTDKAALVESLTGVPWGRREESSSRRSPGEGGASPAEAPRPTTMAGADVPSKPSLLAWRGYDADASGDLDAAELERCVAALRADPGRMLFRQYLQPASREGSHPSYRERILLLYDAFAGT
jgi:Zn-dependent protease with chaperone function